MFNHQIWRAFIRENWSPRHTLASHDYLLVGRFNAGNELLERKVEQRPLARICHDRHSRQGIETSLMSHQSASDVKSHTNRSISRGCPQTWQRGLLRESHWLHATVVLWLLVQLPWMLPWTVNPALAGTLWPDRSQFYHLQCRDDWHRVSCLVGAQRNRTSDHQEGLVGAHPPESGLTTTECRLRQG